MIDKINIDTFIARNEVTKQSRISMSLRISEIASSRQTGIRNDGDTFYSSEKENFTESINSLNEYRQEDGDWHESQA